jgi:hypothetical protein
MQTLNLISRKQESFKIEGRGYYAPITSLCSDLNEIYRETE